MATRQDFSGSNARVAGDEWKFAAQVSGGLSADGVIVTLSLRRYRDTPDPGYVTIAGYAGYTAEGVVIAADTYVTFSISRAVTALIPAGTCWYEVKVENYVSDSYKTTVFLGQIQVLPWSGQSAELVATGGAALVLTTSLAAVPSYDQVTLASIITTLGARLHFWYELGVSTQSLDGSNNFSQLNDLGPGGYHVTQANSVERPSYQAAAGPNGLPCMTFQDATKYLANSTLSLSAGRALTFFTISKASPGGAAIQALCRVANTANAGDIAEGVVATVGNWQTVAKPIGVAEETVTITTPAVDASWHLRVTRFAPTLGVVHKIDDVAVSPPFSATMIGLADAVENVVLGHPTFAGGSLYLRACAENLTGAEATMIRVYIAGKTLL